MLRVFNKTDGLKIGASRRTPEMLSCTISKQAISTPLLKLINATNLNTCHCGFIVHPVEALASLSIQPLAYSLEMVFETYKYRRAKFHIHMTGKVSQRNGEGLYRSKDVNHKRFNSFINYSPQLSWFTFLWRGLLLILGEFLTLCTISLILHCLGKQDVEFSDLLLQNTKDSVLHATCVPYP